MATPSVNADTTSVTIPHIITSPPYHTIGSTIFSSQLTICPGKHTYTNNPIKLILFNMASPYSADILNTIVATTNEKLVSTRIAFTRVHNSIGLIPLSSYRLFISLPYTLKKTKNFNCYVYSCHS